MQVPGAGPLFRSEEFRKITAPGLKFYVFPLNGTRHQVYASAGVSVFHQHARISSHSLRNGILTPETYTRTQLDYFLSGGLGYHYYITEAVGLGTEFQLYSGTNVPNPLARSSIVWWDINVGSFCRLAGWDTRLSSGFR